MPPQRQTREVGFGSPELRMAMVVPAGAPDCPLRTIGRWHPNSLAEPEPVAAVLRPSKRPNRTSTEKNSRACPPVSRSRG